MVDTSRILSAPDITTLRNAVAAAFEEIELEKSNFIKIGEIDTRLKALEDKPA